MRSKPYSLRQVICVFLAAAFMFAAQPGTMAMPSAAMTATTMHGPAKHRHDMPADPCKNMIVCGGLLACYGVTAISVDQPVLPRVSVNSPVPDFTVTAAGMTHPPDSRPPIA